MSPLYEYACANSKCPRYTVRATELRAFTGMDAPAKCPDCGKPAYRCIVPSSPASFRIGKGTS